MQRRLSDLDRSYQSLVDEARREVALKLVGETRHSLVEVAFLTGFSEQSSFTRAFKRWSDKTPRTFRGEASLMTAIHSQGLGAWHEHHFADVSGWAAWPQSVARRTS